MTTQFAKENVSIEDYLAWKGYSASKKCGCRLYYRSPFRHNTETRPSLSVNLVDKRWIDWGLDVSDPLPIKGSVVDMACRFCGSIEAGLKDLELFYGNSGIINTIKMNNCESKYDLKQSQSLVVIRDSSVQMQALLAYAESRRIERDVLNEYCREVWYKNGASSKERFSLGIMNISGGWELSSPGFKCSTSPKSYSFFPKGSNEALVFEGMFDMLSWVMNAKFHGRNITRDIICLNSVVNVEKAITQLSEYDRVYLFLDNDNAGSSASALISASCQSVEDWRPMFAPYKDVNEWWCMLRKNCTFTSPIPHREGGKSI